MDTRLSDVTVGDLMLIVGGVVVGLFVAQLLLLAAWWACGQIRDFWDRARDRYYP